MGRAFIGHSLLVVESTLVTLSCKTRDILQEKPEYCAQLPRWGDQLGWVLNPIPCYELVMHSPWDEV